MLWNMKRLCNCLAILTALAVTLSTIILSLAPHLIDVQLPLDSGNRECADKRIMQRLVRRPD